MNVFLFDAGHAGDGLISTVLQARVSGELSICEVEVLIDQLKDATYRLMELVERAGDAVSPDEE